MSSKKKLKRKLHKQRITHLLAVSDLNIELDKVKYSLTFTESKVSQLSYQNELLQAMVDRLTKETPSEEFKTETQQLPC